MARHKLGRPFGWLWSAYAASTVGTWLGFGAFPLIAIQVLHAGPAAVSALAAAGLAAGALLAFPLGPWVEARRKKPVMIGADLVRCAALLTVSAACFTGRLTWTQLLAVSVIGTAANIAFTAAGGAYLKQLVRPDQLLVANGRFESTTWTATAFGPTAGGAAITLLGPTVTVMANATGFLLSALGIGAIRRREAEPGHGRAAAGRLRAADVLEGWRFIHDDRNLRPLFWNTVAVNALIMATEPLLAVLLLDGLGWAAWQYGLAFGLPCIGGFAGARAARRLEARYGRRRVLAVSGTLRVVWPVGLVLVVPGNAGVALVVAVELGLITCMGVFNPLFATERLQRVPAERLGRVLVAWKVTGTGAIAGLTALGGALATVTGPRTTIAVAGALLLATPLLHRAAAAPGAPCPVGSSWSRDGTATDPCPGEPAGVRGRVPARVPARDRS
ncbi:MFS transporter [Streptomyces sp. NBC_00249]|uniref:MFS transporter n=1 Tax=Streptomyces sp. NBC_00249 TaxID=2975690 RepID=UPI00224FA893|nr:MFS transporter [Streptomyces sp. NBC_00249]MCX5192459.1 MFS transporter [Streptomyces sp. NBC_00249]